MRSSFRAMQGFSTTKMTLQRFRRYHSDTNEKGRMAVVKIAKELGYSEGFVHKAVRPELQHPTTQLLYLLHHANQHLSPEEKAKSPLTKKIFTEYAKLVAEMDMYSMLQHRNAIKCLIQDDPFLSFSPYAPKSIIDHIDAEKLRQLTLSTYDFGGNKKIEFWEVIANKVGLDHFRKEIATKEWVVEQFEALTPCLDLRHHPYLQDRHRNHKTNLLNLIGNELIMMHLAQGKDKNDLESLLKFLATEMQHYSSIDLDSNDISNSCLSIDWTLQFIRNKAHLIFAEMLGTKIYKNFLDDFIKTTEQLLSVCKHFSKQGVLFSKETSIALGITDHSGSLSLFLSREALDKIPVGLSDISNIFMLVRPELFDHYFSKEKIEKVLLNAITAETTYFQYKEKINRLEPKFLAHIGIPNIKNHEFFEELVNKKKKPNDKEKLKNTRLLSAVVVSIGVVSIFGYKQLFSRAKNLEEEADKKAQVKVRS